MIVYQNFMNEGQEDFTIRRELPVQVKQVPKAPIIANMRWKASEEGLVKTFLFMHVSQRDKFINSLLEYEDLVKHNATIVIKQDRVGIMVITHDIGSVTEIDKEYASYCDVLYRDVTYEPNTY